MMMALRMVMEAPREETSDGELLLRYRNADLEAAGALYDHHNRGLYAYALSLLGDEGAAEDTVQETFLRLLEYDPRKSVGSIQAFLYTVMRNLSLDQLRSSAVRKKHAEQVAVRTLQRAAGKDPRVSDVQKSVIAELENLPEEQREIIILKTYTDLTFQEIARTLEIAVGTAVSRYRYALEKLADRLGAE